MNIGSFVVVVAVALIVLGFLAGLYLAPWVLVLITILTCAIVYSVTRWAGRDDHKGIVGCLTFIFTGGMSCFLLIPMWLMWFVLTLSQVTLPAISWNIFLR